MAEQRALFLKRCLMKDEEVSRKHRATMKDYIERRHAERVPEEELSTRDKWVWYLPHHAVTHPLKPVKGEVGSWLCSKVWTNITSSCWHRSNVSPIPSGPKRLWKKDYGGRMGTWQRKWKSIEWWNIYLVLHFHQALLISVLGRQPSLIRRGLMQK